MRWHKKPVLQFVVMGVVMSSVLALQQGISRNVLNVWAKGEYASPPKVATNTLQNSQTIPGSQPVAAANGCSYTEGAPVTSGLTESDPNNAEPRWPIKDKRGEYDVLNTQYFARIINQDSKYQIYYDDLGPNDLRLVQSEGMLYSMFGYRPKRFVNAFDMKYQDPFGTGLRGNDPSSTKGNYPILQVPTQQGAVIKMANLEKYDIGGGEAMVVYAESDRITLHVGRHEYFVGSKKCADGSMCSGGYWIYLSGVCVNGNILAEYNRVRSAQENAKADLTPINLPIIPGGYPLAQATGTSVMLALRDNGPFILMNENYLWNGPIEKDFQIPTTSPVQPTSPPRATPTPNCVWNNSGQCVRITPTPNCVWNSSGQCVRITPTRLPGGPTPIRVPNPGIPTNTPIPSTVVPIPPTSTPITPTAVLTPEVKVSIPAEGYIYGRYHIKILFHKAVCTDGSLCKDLQDYKEYADLHGESKALSNTIGGQRGGKVCEQYVLESTDLEQESKNGIVKYSYSFYLPDNPNDTEDCKKLWGSKIDVDNINYVSGNNVSGNKQRKAISFPVPLASK